MDQHADSRDSIESRRFKTMVTVAQLVEHWTVTPVVAGSNPVSHPIIPLSISNSNEYRAQSGLFSCSTLISSLHAAIVNYEQDQG